MAKPSASQEFKGGSRKTKNIELIAYTPGLATVVLTQALLILLIFIIHGSAPGFLTREKV